MEFILTLGRQPLFRLLAAVIVLLVTDLRPVWGAVAAVVWAGWVIASQKSRGRAALF
jgi:hypothetical protein